MMNWLKTHKSMIFGVMCAIIPYLMTKGIIGLDEAQLIGNVSAVFGFTASWLTNRKK